MKTGLQKIGGSVLVISAAAVFSIIFLAVSGSIEGMTLGISVLLGVSSLWLPFIIPAAFITATLLVPNEILPFLSGGQELYGFGFLRLHPAGIVLFIGSFLAVVSKRRILSEFIKGSRTLSFVIIVFIIFITSTLIQTSIFRGVKGIPQCLENYLFPLSFFLYILTLERVKAMLMLKWYISLILLIAVYGIFEYFAGGNLLYGRLYIESTPHFGFFAGRDAYRITTTLGHPLKNAVFFLFAIPITLFSFKKPVNFILAMVLIIAVFLTASRVAAILAIASILAYYTNITPDLRRHFKNMAISIFLIAVAYFCLFYTPVGSMLIRRFTQEHESVFIRMQAFGYAGELMRGNLLFGEGMGTSFDRSVSLFNKLISFENPWFMLTNDVGLITTSAYFMIFIILLLKSIKGLKAAVMPKAMSISFISILIMISSFSSFGIRNTINLLVWFNIALLFQNNKIVPARGAQ